MNPPNIVLIASDSIQEIDTVNPTTRFGNVYKINFDTLSFYNGDNVFFDVTEAILITQNDTSYFIIDENKIKFTEDPIL
jgi:co-chaperonin GroES (HSP10)